MVFSSHPSTPQWRGIIVVFVAHGGDFLPAQIDEVAFNMILSCCEYLLLRKDID